MKWCSIVPAYGRTYNHEEAQQAFHSNKDFILRDISSRWNGQLCNKKDLIKYGNYTHVEIRYGKHNEHIHVEEIG